MSVMRGCRRSGRCFVLSLLLYVVILPGYLIHLLHENSTLKAKVATLVQESRANDSLSQHKPTTRKRPPRKFNRSTQSSLTFLLSQRNGLNKGKKFYKRRLQDLKRQFPSSPLVIRNAKNRTLGASLNQMVSAVKTEYFLLLEPNAKLSNRPKEGIAYLWHALEQYPELDFVGGSYMSKEKKLRVACYRFRLCQWTLSESYEYERSFDNVMICDSPSSSFMGRTQSVKKLGFDVKLSDLFVVKDFFLRAKARGDIVVGTRPNVVFLIDNFTELHQLWNSGKITKKLAQFAVKHKVFKIKDAGGNVIDICSATSPLRGKGVCIEKNSHKLMLNGSHWAYEGLFTYPYLLQYLEITLSEISNFFNTHNVSYLVDGGVALGAIKMRSILPWEAGDIDIDVYEMTLDKLYTLLEPWAEEKGYVVKKYDDEAVHVFCTPKNVGSLSGGLVTIFPREGKPPPLIKIETNGIWVSYDRDLIHTLIHWYGNGYLQHKMYASNETVHCKMKDHNACLPNFKSLFQGRAGNLKEFFCQI